MPVRHLATGGAAPGRSRTRAAWRPPAHAAPVDAPVGSIDRDDDVRA
ncbi:hypothetical protein K9F17_09765 [Stenotrophomonas acidaminiphila]|nr:hypothetical protein [Stenotrophomonas acidaminiphila]